MPNQGAGGSKALVGEPPSPAVGVSHRKESENLAHISESAYPPEIKKGGHP
jgi:hypothetical protein